MCAVRVCYVHSMVTDRCDGIHPDESLLYPVSATRADSTVSLESRNNPEVCTELTIVLAKSSAGKVTQHPHERTIPPPPQRHVRPPQEKPKKKYRKKVVNEQENEGACGNGEPAPAVSSVVPLLSPSHSLYLLHRVSVAFVALNTMPVETLRVYGLQSLLGNVPRYQCDTRARQWNG